MNNLPRKRSFFGNHNPQVALDFVTLINSDHKNTASPQVPKKPIIVNAGAAAVSNYRKNIEQDFKT